MGVRAQRFSALQRKRDDAESILPGVTRRSILTLAEDRLGMEVERRPVDLRNEIENIDEIGA